MVVQVSKAKQAPYLFTKRGRHYFQRRVPADLRRHYCSPTIQMALGTAELSEAKAQSVRCLAELEDQWARLRRDTRARKLDRLLIGHSTSERADPGPDEIMSLYLSRRGPDKSPQFALTTQRAYGYLRKICGDCPLSGYKRQDANKLRDGLLAQGLAPQSVKRTISAVSTGVNLAIAEHGLERPNVFAKIDYGRSAKVKERIPFTEDELRYIKSEVRSTDDEPRWLVALISDTGMRLSEASGLAREDLVTSVDKPYLTVRSHPWRSLKTEASERQIPLVGASLWAASRILAQSKSEYAFPEICDGRTTNANATSAKLNKWLRPRSFGQGKVVHSLRHSLRDRLRAVECPADIVDQLGGWSEASVGKSYGRGYPLTVLYKWMAKIPLH